MKEKLIRKDIEIKFEKHFTNFWKQIINYNTLRNQFVCKLLGSPQVFVIVQVIAWHHYLVTIDEVSTSGNSFENALKNWSDTDLSATKRRLSISLVSELTNISFETTRRYIKKLVKKEWIQYSKKTGIIFNSNSRLNEIIVNEIHPYEKKLLKEVMVAFLMIDAKK